MFGALLALECFLVPFRFSPQDDMTFSFYDHSASSCEKDSHIAPWLSNLCACIVRDLISNLEANAFPGPHLSHSALAILAQCPLKFFKSSNPNQCSFFGAFWHTRHHIHTHGVFFSQIL
jgi:hypothetical protein